MQYKNLILNVDNDALLGPLFEITLDFIDSGEFPDLDGLIDAATEAGPIKVNFVNNTGFGTDATFGESEKTYHGKKVLERYINIVRSNDFLDGLEALIFELCNAKNPYFRLGASTSIIPEKYANRDDYAKAVEKAEYRHTHVPSRDILRQVFNNDEFIQALKANGLVISEEEEEDTLSNLRTDPYSSFEEWWNAVNRDGHADLYRSSYDSDPKRGRRVQDAPVISKTQLSTSSMPNHVPSFQPTPLVYSDQNDHLFQNEADHLFRFYPIKDSVFTRSVAKRIIA